MTTDTRADVAARAASTPSIHVVRARQLLLGGLAGGVAATLVMLVVFGLLDGTRGLLSVLLASLVVLFFYVLGQLVMVRFADAGARLLMAVALASYTFRVLVLGVVLVVFDRNRDTLTAVEPQALFWTVCAVVVGWLAVEIVVFTRLRITVFDTPYEDPTGDTAQ